MRPKKVFTASLYCFCVLACVAACGKPQLDGVVVKLMFTSLCRCLVWVAVCAVDDAPAPAPPRVQEPAMFDRGTRGRFLRTLSPQNLTAEPGVGSCARPWATPYRGKKIFRCIAPGHACPLLSHS